MTSGHLVAFRDFTFLSNIYTNELVDTWRQFISVFTSEHLHINDNTVGTMWYTQRGITHFTSFLTKDRMQQAFFCCKFSYTFRRYFTNKNITSTDLSTNTDNAAFVEIAKRFFPNIRNVASNFFRSKLRITGFRFVLLNMNRGIYVFLNQFFTKQDRILIVITFPSHKGYNYVTSKSQFTHFGRRPVRKDITLLNDISAFNNRTLIYTGSLVRTHEFV
ncbi:hypothetical protein D3C73_1015820 [compost metagenome]